MHTPVLLRVEDAFKASVTQTHAVPGFLVLYHQKVALNGGCAGEDGFQTADKPLQQRVHVVESIPSILVCGAIVKAVNGALQFRLVAVRIAKGLVLAPNIINLLDFEGVFDTLLVALQIDREVAGQNADNLMGQNTGSSANTGFVVFVSLHNDGADSIHQSKDGSRRQLQQRVTIPNVHFGEAVFNKQSQVLNKTLTATKETA